MIEQRDSLKPIEGATRSGRHRLTVQDELFLALLPTLTILLVLGLVEALSEQRLLFASLAASAFLIYLDPEHGTNSIRTLIVSQSLAALIGLLTFLLFGPGYLAAGSAMLATIMLMIVLDSVHPPAVASAISFAFRAGEASNIALFGLALGIIAVLVVLERVVLWQLARVRRRSRRPLD